MTGVRGAVPVRVGLIGCGTIAYWSHLRALQQREEFVGDAPCGSRQRTGVTPSEAGAIVDTRFRHARDTRLD